MGPGILDKTIDIVEKSLPFLGNSIKESRMSFGDKFERIGEDLCSSLFSVYGKDEQRYEQAVKGYAKFCISKSSYLYCPLFSNSFCRRN